MTHDFQLWCEDCQKGYEGDCEKHGPLKKVADTEVSTRARRSIPHVLKLKDDISHTGVYARELLNKRLLFGPLQAEKVLAGSQQATVEEEIKERFGIVYKITQQEGDYLLLDTQQEERSNWMIFVRPAERKADQNLVAFQYKGDIYFTTIKEIPAQCELRVWYSKDYAERMGTRILAEEGVSWQFRTRQRFRCRGCEVVFSSAASLTNHRCSRSHQISKSETPVSRGRQTKKSVKERVESQITATPSTSGRKFVGSSTSQGKEPQRGRIQVKGEIASPSSSTESEESEIISLSPERQSPRSSPRGRGSVYTCPVCEKVFHSPGKLKQHSYSHTGERPFSCTLCHKAFSSRFKLVRHQLIHTTERQHQCPLCDRSFHRKDHLKNHIQIHDPNKQFKCEKPDCGKEYNSYMSYRKHCAVHAAEEGDLQCKICQKMFETKSDLIYHLKVHVGSRSVKSPSEKKFQCDHCERRFFTRKDVKRHHVVHTGKRDFSCNMCPQKFGRKDHLVRHIKKSHGISDLNRIESLELSATPGPSSVPPSVSPSASVASPPPSTTVGTQPLSSMVLIPEPIAGPSGLSGSSNISGATGLMGQAGETQYIEPSFQQDYSLFEETIKEEPELQPSMEEISPGGDDLSKILGMYLPTGSINISGPPLLEPATHHAEEGISQRSLLESALLRIPQGDQKDTGLVGQVDVFSRGSIESRTIMSGPQTGEFSQEAAVLPTNILPRDSPGISVRSLHSPEPVSQLPSGRNSGVPTSVTTTSAAVTTTASHLPSLPGFDQAFPQ